MSYMCITYILIFFLVFLWVIVFLRTDWKVVKLGVSFSSFRASVLRILIKGHGGLSMEPIPKGKGTGGKGLA